MFSLRRWVSGRHLARGISTVTKDTTIGVVGCGNVGQAVGHNLARSGFKVVAAYDVDKTRMASMPKAMIRVKTAKEVAERADVVVTGLPRPSDVLAAAEGPDGLLAGLGPDKVWIDHSTTDYHQTLKFSKDAEAKGAHVVEAPITGGLEALKKGQMVVHLGGDEAVCNAVMPLLKASYHEMFYVGPIGSAMIVKVVSNMLACVNIIAMGEVLMLAKRAGIDLHKFWDAIRVSAGNSFAWETGGPTIFNGSYDPGFTMGLLCKDLQLGYDMAKDHRVPMDLHQLVLSIYRRGQYQFGDEAGCYIPPKCLEEAMGESLNIPGFEKWVYDNEINNRSIAVKHSNIKLK